MRALGLAILARATRLRGQAAVIQLALLVGRNTDFTPSSAAFGASRHRLLWDRMTGLRHACSRRSEQRSPSHSVTPSPLRRLQVPPRHRAPRWRVRWPSGARRGTRRLLPRARGSRPRANLVPRVVPTRRNSPKLLKVAAPLHGAGRRFDPCPTHRVPCSALL